jgi:transcriptional regulator with GAF, ATPase, and Fis domain
MSASGLHMYKFCCHEKTTQPRTGKYKQLTDYFESKRESKGFPVVILSEHHPSHEEMENYLVKEKDLWEDHQLVILAIKDNAIKESWDTWHFLETGFADVITWNSEEEIINYLESKHERTKTINDILESPLVADNLVGRSVIWKRFVADIIEATLFSSTPILLIGESGTGKELISRLIHTLDRRPNKKKLIIVDCTTIVPELSGSELFGHERGSYTNAIQSREGAFALANEGTLFLDEVGELPMNLQAELLRVLQEGSFKKVGSNTWQKTAFRLVCATNCDLRKAVTEGRFRQDLYFRIAGCECTVPELSSRKDDVPCLVSHFLSKLFSEGQCPEVDKAVMDYLVQRDYPGNVRELKQLVQRIAIKHVQHKKITIGEVPEKERNQYCGHKVRNNVEGIEEAIRKALLTGEDWWNLKGRISETAIRVALDLENNNKQKAAERLGVDVRTVQQYVKKNSGEDEVGSKQ